MHISFQLSVFIFFENVLQNRVAGLCDSLIFRFLGEPPFCFTQWLHQLTFLPTEYEDSLLFTSLPDRCPQEDASCLLTFWETLKSASKGYFQTASSVLVLGACRFCAHPFRVGSVFPVILQLSCSQSQLAFKARCSVSSSSPYSSPRLGNLMWSLGPSLFWENSAIVILLLCSVGHLPCPPSPGSVWLDFTRSLPLLSSSFFIFFTCRKSFLLVFKMFSYMVAL